MTEREPDAIPEDQAEPELDPAELPEVPEGTELPADEPVEEEPAAQPEEEDGA